MYAFLSILLEPSPKEACLPQKHQIKNAYVKQAICFIKANYSRPITIEELAQTLGLNRKYFAELFKSAAGMPPQQYLSRYRMSKACELLESSELSIKEIAYSVGYTDQLLFSRMFKKIIGMSPSDYRVSEGQTGLRQDYP
ncbi:helix-turn-helix domain-containing protein [Paenibacillus caui]|uniref:helix-turn-helix domain-containing protein n=1 Tax=Paenibacillus caui TaxID=2873927 RepID=UPI00235787FF|nr:AraC family transcriptional regulator [Paenibacillus caui]